MSAADNIQTCKGMYAAFKRGDRGAMVARSAENIQIELDIGVGEIPWAGEYQGHAGLEKNQDLLAETVQVDVLEQLDYFASETQVVVVNKIEMTVKKNGQKVSLPRYVQFMSFDAAGKLAKVCEAYDPTPLIAALRR